MGKQPEKIILYYCFTPLADPAAVKLWQHSLCDSLGLKGRILLSNHGINGTLGGSVDSLKKYVSATKNYQPFKLTQFKWSHGSADDFPRLSVKVRREIVTFGAPEELAVNERGVIGGGKHLKPSEVHELVDTYGDDVVFFDGRNAYEASVGKFKNAVVPRTTYTRDFIDDLDSGRYDQIKSKKVVTYCTGGIRCEVLTSIMKKRGFRDVFQLDGGIVKYGEAYGDDGLWEGALYVFDRRMTTKFSDRAKDIGSCIHCQAKTSNFANCALKTCNKLILVCKTCAATEPGRYHTAACQKSALKPAKS